MTGAGTERADAITVQGTPGEVARQLATWAGGGSWPEFQLVRDNGPIFVNPALVRHIQEAPES